MQNELQGREKSCVDVAPPESAAQMAREVRSLTSNQVLYTSGQYSVGIARRDQVPTIVEEIGRLRELSFRAVGEGTGHAKDLDEFDNWYMHLFVWDEASQQILGAYRIGLTDVIIRQRGLHGLYTSTLFDYSERFFDGLGPALEMGRSFVRTEYQRSSRVLAFLWRGIGRLISLRPRYSQLFGPVSVSSHYTEASRQLIAKYLLTEDYRHPLHDQVRPLRPVDTSRVQNEAVAADIKPLVRRVSEIEADGKTVPTLVREYVKLGGRFCAFSIDPDFGDALDGLVAVDLDRTSPRLLKLYMGPEAYEHFSLRRLRSDRVQGPAATYVNA